MTPREMKKRLAECGPEPTDQDRLKISIKHHKIAKDQYDDIVGVKYCENFPSYRNCALCDKYFNVRNCNKQGMCMLGNRGCLTYYDKIRDALRNKDKPAFLAAADEMIAFLESFLEKEDDMLVMRKNTAHAHGISLDKQPYPFGVIVASRPGDKKDIELLDLALHHFNGYEEIAPKYEQMVAMLKEWEKDYECRMVSDHNARSIITDLLAIAEPKPPEPQLKVGDEIEAGQVPIGAKVSFEDIDGVKIRHKSNSDDKGSVCFYCELCGSDGCRFARLNTKCTILELPDADKK